MPNIQVAFVWDVYYPTPGTPLYEVKDTDGIIHLAHLDAQGNVTKLLKSGLQPPTVIHGCDPKNPTQPKDFGSWTPIEDWKIAYDL